MLRALVCTFVALALFATSGRADDTAKKKKKAGTSGTITAVDPAKGTVTVEVKLKENATEKKIFKVTDKTAVTAGQGKKNTTEIKADKVADLLKKEQFKVGATVNVEPSDADAETAKAITFVTKKKAAGTSGTIAAVDAAKGTVTVEVKV